MLLSELAVEGKPAFEVLVVLDDVIAHLHFQIEAWSRRVPNHGGGSCRGLWRRREILLVELRDVSKLALNSLAPVQGQVQISTWDRGSCELAQRHLSVRKLAIDIRKLAIK